MSAEILLPIDKLPLEKEESTFLDLKTPIRLARPFNKFIFECDDQYEPDLSILEKYNNGN